MVAERRTATVEDLLTTPDDGQTYELIDGAIVVSPAPSPRHQQVSTILTHRLESWSLDADLGLVFAAPADVMLYEGVVLRPDLFFISHDNPGAWVDTIFYGAPDLVVEILSPSSIGKDTITKGQRYARAGVTEYWIIGQDPRATTAYEVIDGLWTERPPDEDGLITSVAMPGLRIELRSLFDQADHRLRNRRPGSGAGT